MRIKAMVHAAIFLGTAALVVTAGRNCTKKSAPVNICDEQYPGRHKVTLGDFKKDARGNITEISVWEGDRNYRVDFVRREIHWMWRAEIKKMPRHSDRSEVISLRHFVGSNNGNSFETVDDRNAYLGTLIWVNNGLRCSLPEKDPNKAQLLAAIRWLMGGQKPLTVYEL